jgi:hypothetical protein
MDCLSCLFYHPEQRRFLWTSLTLLEFNQPRIEPHAWVLALGAASLGVVNPTRRHFAVCGVQYPIESATIDRYGIS